MDWIIGLNLFISHDLHPIECCKFGCSKYTSSFYCMLGNVHECIMHKLHGRMCIMNSWCTRSELKALSYYSKRKRASNVLPKGLFTTKNVLPECWRMLVFSMQWSQMVSNGPKWSPIQMVSNGLYWS